ncbi:MAG: dihydrolipoyl dehydrogenase, partial [Pseudomonadota bacterium]
SELIGQAVIAMECESSAEDVARMVFGHPTLSESVHEAMLSVD